MLAVVSSPPKLDPKRLTNEFGDAVRALKLAPLTIEFICGRAAAASSVTVLLETPPTVIVTGCAPGGVFSGILKVTTESVTDPTARPAKSGVTNMVPTITSTGDVVGAAVVAATPVIIGGLVGPSPIAEQLTEVPGIARLDNVIGLPE